MKLHEYQAKEIFRRFEIPVPKGKVVSSGDEAFQAARELKGPPWVVKAQVHAGGRGKGGGVKVVQTVEEVKKAATAILENPLVTKQTGPQGRRVHQVLIEEGVAIDREFYLAVVIDRSRAQPVMIFSQAGGMDIEEVAARTPELVLKQFVRSQSRMDALSSEEIWPMASTLFLVPKLLRTSWPSWPNSTGFS